MSIRSIASYVTCIATLFAVLSVPASLQADGKGDNDPANVRRVPRAGVKVPADRDAALVQSLKVLQEKIAELRSSKNKETDDLLPDVMIFERAVRVALDHDEFFSPKDIDKADQLLAEGFSRADQLLAGNPKWPNESGLVVRGYISRIDHTVQPYGLVVPKTYAFNHSVPTRCDVWFHGRGETLSEVNFLWDRMKNAGQYTPDHTIMLHPYGRYSNAFKFAGETDVLEALEDVQKRYRIDEDRISVRGFSMGGAACWQFAVHYPDRWFAANPGAGFSETPQFLKFFQQETLNPTPWETKLWNLYDCDKYAMNLRHCPTIAYSGENDIQKQAADVMEVELKQHKIRLRHVIGPDMGHKIDEASKHSIETSMTSMAASGRKMSKQLGFETYTLKYNQLQWLRIEGLQEHWRRARVQTSLYHDGGWGFGGYGNFFVTDALPDNFDDDSLETPSKEQATQRKHQTEEELEAAFDIVSAADRNMQFRVENVSALSVDLPPGVFSLPPALDVGVSIFDVNAERLDAVSVRGPRSDGSWQFRIRKDDQGEWKEVVAPPDALHKRHNLQGPIDDAFMDSFVFVRPTGTAANEAVGKWAEAELERAIEHWRRHFRGDARVVDDTDVTDELIESANLVLWGDTSSNSVMAKVAGTLPVKWTEKQIDVGNRTYDAAHHAPILIYPNPLNPNRYVVLNSSFTYRDYAYLNNARQVPMLPDWAVIDLRTPPGNVWPGKVVAADFFDEQWQLKK